MTDQIEIDRVRKTKAYQQRKAQLKDRNWRLDNLYFIKDENGDTVQFKRNAAQRGYCVAATDRDLLPKARQLGFSTEILIEMLDRCVFMSGQSCGVIDDTLGDARKKLAKVKFAYERLPPEIREIVTLTKDNTEEIHFSNGSKIEVGTSYRGDTLQFLLISEFGKTSVDKPDKARETKTGAMRAVHVGNRIVIESTAHGTAGEFYEMVTAADNLEKSGQSRTALDFKVHFFGWWMKPEYRLPANLVHFSQEILEYFAEIEPILLKRYGVRLDVDQKAWYAKQRADLGPDDCKSEFPTIFEECFQKSLLGTFWKKEIQRARGDKRIGLPLPYDPSRPVNTFWDIGEDMTAIWFHQTDGVRHRFIDYYEEEGWSLQGAIGLIDRKRVERGFVYGKHYGPHDFGNREWGHDKESRKEVAAKLGLRIEVVPAPFAKADAIEAGRRMLNMAWFCCDHTELGVQRLENYRKKWNKTVGMFTADPVHDAASHGADSFMTGARGLEPEKVKREGDRHARGRGERRGSQWAS